MSRNKSYFALKPDAMTEEMVVALLAKPSYDFHELFGVVHQGLRARRAAAGGEDVLRLRLYEKLQKLVARGMVRKAQKQYSSVETALRAHSVELATAKAHHQERAAAQAKLATPTE